MLAQLAALDKLLAAARPAAARSRSPGITSAASCWSASGSRCSSIAIRRFSSCRPSRRPAPSMKSARRSCRGIGVVVGRRVLHHAATTPRCAAARSIRTRCKKSMRGFDICRQNRLPLHHAHRVGRRRPAAAVGDLPARRSLVPQSHASSRPLGIPTISLVFGNSTAGGAYTPAMCDYTVFVKDRAKVFLGGPPLVKMATGEDVERRGAGRRRDALPRVRASPTTWPPTSSTRCGSAARSSPT